LVDVNFGEIKWSHDVLPLEHVKLHLKYIYIYREFGPVSRSVYKIREWFGIKIDSYEKFLNTKYNQMWTKNLKPRVLSEIGGHVSTRVCIMFRNVEKQPEEYWELHIEHWKNLSDKLDNIIIIKYEDLLKNFNIEMDKISTFLIGEKKDNYMNFRKKLGPLIEGDFKIHF